MILSVFDLLCTCILLLYSCLFLGFYLTKNLSTDRLPKSSMREEFSMENSLQMCLKTWTQSFVIPIIFFSQVFDFYSGELLLQYCKTVTIA